MGVGETVPHLHGEGSLYKCLVRLAWLAMTYPTLLAPAGPGSCRGPVTGRAHRGRKTMPKQSLSADLTKPETAVGERGLGKRGHIDKREQLACVLHDMSSCILRRFGDR